MFESDDFDQVLSQFEFPDVSSKLQSSSSKVGDSVETPNNVVDRTSSVSSSEFPNIGNRNESQAIQNRNDIFSTTISSANGTNVMVSPKHMKRKIINSLFDTKNKRKFPGPAGLLTGTLEETRNENICHMDLLSQDIDFSENDIRKDLFESPLWIRLLDDIKSWSFPKIDPIKAIKQQALAGNLCRRKAQTVAAFIETVDRSAIDPLIILRDITGNIKCTLHRDAWSTFSSYIVSEYCALVLWKPTVLTTGSAFKKHYLNITLSNIYAIYSSAVLKDDDLQPLPDGYMRVTEENFTVIKTENVPHETTFVTEAANHTDDLLDGLDSVFSDDLF